MPSRPASSRLMRLAVAASALLVLAGLAAFWYASTLVRKSPGPEAHAVRVVIDDKTCTPNDITVPAGAPHSRSSTGRTASWNGRYATV